MTGHASPDLAKSQVHVIMLTAKGEEIDRVAWPGAWR
jgi:DNA-binding response OmpR family regulator